MKTENKKTDNVNSASEHERSKKIHHNLDVGLHDKKVDEKKTDGKFPESNLSKNPPVDTTSQPKRDAGIEALADDLAGSTSPRVSANDPDDLAGISGLANGLHGTNE